MIAASASASVAASSPMPIAIPGEAPQSSGFARHLEAALQPDRALAAPPALLADGGAAAAAKAAPTIDEPLQVDILNGGVVGQRLSPAPVQRAKTDQHGHGAADGAGPSADAIGAPTEAEAESGSVMDGPVHGSEADVVDIASPSLTAPTAPVEPIAPPPTARVSDARVESDKPVGPDSPTRGVGPTIAAEQTSARSGPVDASPVALARRAATTELSSAMPDPQSESAPPGQAIATHSPVTTIIPGQPAPTLSAQAALPIALTPSPTGEPRLLDIAGDDRWIADLAASIVRARSDDGAVQFRLRPEALGAMRVEIEPVGDGASVRLIVETSAAAAMLADGQARLAADARASGMKSFSSAVLFGDTGAQGNSGQTGEHPRQARPRTGDAPQRSDPVQHYDDPTRFA